MAAQRVDPHLELRDEGLLRLFFADALAPEQALALVTRLRRRTEEIPVAQGAASRFPLIAAREGADYFAWRATWFRKLDAELTRRRPEERRTGGARNAPP
jgi:hypothetical protein